MWCKPDKAALCGSEACQMSSAVKASDAMSLCCAGLIRQGSQHCIGQQ